MEQYTSIKVVLDKVHRNPLLSDVSLETAVDYCVDFMRIVGVPRMFVDKIAIVTLSNYRAVLPTDFIELIQIRRGYTVLRHATDTFHLSQNRVPTYLITSEYDEGSIPITSLSEVIDVGVTYKLTTNTAIKYYQLINDAATQVDYVHIGTYAPITVDDTFIIQGGYIHSTVKEGDIEVAYRAIPVDDYGMPMIPDNSNFTRALEAYIKVQHYSILFDLGKINQHVLNKAQQDYAWAVGAAETDARKLDLSRADAFFNSFRTLIIRDNEFNNSWRNDGSKQVLLNQK